MAFEPTPDFFPSPTELWGDYKVDIWTGKQSRKLGFILGGISSRIIYTNQNTIDRINIEVPDIIAKARSGELGFDEVMEKLHYNNIFTKEELEEIAENVKNHGYTVGLAWIKKHGKTPN